MFFIYIIVKLHFNNQNRIKGFKIKDILNRFLNITEIKFANLRLLEIIDVIKQNIKNNQKLLISSPNVHICNYARKNSEFAKLINNFSLIHPDGVGVFLASRFLYGKRGLKERMTGTDLYLKLFTDYYNLKYFLIGGVEDCQKRIEKRFESLTNSNRINIVGSVFKLNNTVSDIELINKSGAEILMVALGTPHQEEWIFKNKDKINAPVIIAVGSGLDFLAGVKKRAPLWMRNIGLEWFYRLFQEPKRLWKRYILGIPVFIYYILKQKVNLMFKKGNT